MGMLSHEFNPSPLTILYHSPQMPCSPRYHVLDAKMEVNILDFPFEILETIFSEAIQPWKTTSTRSWTMKQASVLLSRVKDSILSLDMSCTDEFNWVRQILILLENPLKHCCRPWPYIHNCDPRASPSRFISDKEPFSKKHSKQSASW